MGWPKGRKKALPRYCKRGHDLEAPDAFIWKKQKCKDGSIKWVRVCKGCHRLHRKMDMRRRRGGLKPRPIQEGYDGTWGAMYIGPPCRTCQLSLRYWASGKCVNCNKQRCIRYNARKMKRLAPAADGALTLADQ